MSGWWFPVIYAAGLFTPALWRLLDTPDDERLDEDATDLAEWGRQLVEIRGLPTGGEDE